MDQLIEFQKKFVHSIMDKALLSEKSYQLYKLLNKILQQVNMFTFKKENYFYQSALQEYDRIQSNMQRSEE